MNRDLIENYVLSSNNYTRQLGPYFVPNYTITPSGKIINITNNRRTELYKPDSRYVTSFKKDLDEYSDYDVLGILDISKEDCKWDIILDTVGKKIPRWIIKLLGDFPLGNKYLSEAIDVDSVSDFEILKFVDILRKYYI